MAKISIEEIEKIFNEKKFDELIEKLLPIIQNVDNNNKTTDIPLWNIYYLVGQSYRYKEDFKNALLYLTKSVETFENFLKLSHDATFIDLCRSAQIGRRRVYPGYLATRRTYTTFTTQYK